MKCSYCGKTNPEQKFWIGAPPRTEKHEAMSEFSCIAGTGKLVCGSVTCREKAETEARRRRA